MAGRRPLGRPLQVWLAAESVDPRTVPQFFLHDLPQAYSIYRGEQVVYFEPQRRDAERDAESMTLRVPSTGPAVTATVFHVGATGYVWGPDAGTRFPRSPPTPTDPGAPWVVGLLDAWLRLDPTDVPRPPHQGLWLPPFRQLAPQGPGEADRRAHAEMLDVSRFLHDPDPLAPVLIRWAEHYETQRVGPERRAEGQALATNLRRRAHMRANRPTAIGRALLYATARAFPYVTAAYAPAVLAESFPGFVALETAAQKFRLGGKNRELDSIWGTEEYHRLVPVRRCWGLTGLCWALLIDRLEHGRRESTCSRCGHVLRGAGTLCRRGDNADCVTDQARTRKAQSRWRQRAGHLPRRGP